MSLNRLRPGLLIAALLAACATQTVDGTMDPGGNPAEDSGQTGGDDASSPGFDIPNDFVVPKDDTGNPLPVDTGNAPEDTGNAPVDTGNAPEDTGNAPVDTGNVGFDSGNTPVDTGNTPVDTGVGPRDTGVVLRDTGNVTDTGPRDAGTPSDNGLTGCAAATDCASCGALAGCGWCPGINRCLAGTSSGPSGAGGLRCAGWAWLPSACPTSPTANPCASLANTCGGCSGNFLNCGWCHTTRSCQVGTGTGSTATSCTGTAWAWTPNACVSSTDPCRTSSGCNSCIGRSSCGWCDDSDTCQSGSSSGPSNGSCRSSNWTWTGFLGFCI
ncbi:MAG: hypothetical protein JNK72_19355 [Myxococcales bacterium]|nr:hypothetical protein [Myxococcales bacterium]